MRLYDLWDSVDLSFARVTLFDGSGYKKCKVCSYLVEYPKPQKRVVEWLEGSGQVCSFVWPARLVAEVLVDERVKQVLMGTGVEFLPVEFYQDPKLRRPKRVTKRSKRRVWLPYDGPPLSVLWAPTWVHADLTRSSLSLVSQCPECGHRVYDVVGLEERTYRYDSLKGELVEIHTPRQSGKGIYVQEEALNGTEIFRLYEQPGRILCTERIKRLVEDHAFKNVSFIEVGEVF